MKRISVSILSLVLLLVSGACNVQKNRPAGETAGGAQISPDEIELAGMRLGVDGDGETYHVKGQVQNNSQKLTLTELQVKVSLQDCLETGDCQIIGEQVATIPTDVPAGQNKPFEAETKFKDLPKPRGTLGWHYSIVAAKSK